MIKIMYKVQKAYFCFFILPFSVEFYENTFMKCTVALWMTSDRFKLYFWIPEDDILRDLLVNFYSCHFTHEDKYGKRMQAL
jgi:hypothetical protein